MSEYIDRKALGIDKCNPDVFENKGYAEGWNSAIEIIKNAPAVDVAPVKHGTWQYEGLGLKCSECGLYVHIGSYNERTLKIQSNARHYCERCGAKMEVSKNG